MGILSGENGKRMLYTVGFAAALFLVFRYIFPLIAPFALAFLIVHVCYPWLGRIQKKTHIRKEVLLGGLLLLIIVVLVLGVCGVFSWGTAHAAEISDGIAGAQAQMDEALHGACAFLDDQLALEAGRTEAFLQENLEAVSGKMQSDALPQAAKQSWQYLKEAIGAGAFLGVSFLSALLLCRDYEDLVTKIGEHPAADAVFRFAGRMVSLIGGYLRAQAVILLTISVIAAVGLLLGRIKGALLLGILAGMLDALPFIGTGIVLLPTALWQLLEGNGFGAVTAVVVYALCIAARELLEPKLLGKQVGLYPVVMLLAVYVGVRVFGFTGLFLGPLYAVLFREGVGKILEKF